MKELRIAVDARRLSPGKTGIGRYIQELLQRLPEYLPGVKFYLYSNKPIENIYPPEYFVRRVDDHPVWSRMPGILWLRYRAGRLMQADAVDLCWASGSLLPGPFAGWKTITTVYDFNHILAPQTMQWLNRFSMQLWFGHDVRASDRVFAISQGSADKLQQYFTRQCDAVIRPAVGAVFKPPSATEVERILAQYKLENNGYLLSVGTREPRKNLLALVRCFTQLRKGDYPTLRLVLVGNLGWERGELGQALAALPDQSIVETGYVTDEELVALYAGARLFVFPSIYEGFGIPVAEALAVGARVVASDVTEIREAGSDSVYYSDVGERPLLQTLVRALEDPVETVYSNPGESSWDQGASALAQLFRAELSAHTD